MPAVLSDPDLPALDALLGPEAAACLAPAVAAEGGTIQALTPDSAEYEPGVFCQVAYDATVTYPDGAREDKLVAMARHHNLPEAATRSEAGGMPIAVWRWPHDPYLPGLAEASNRQFVAGLLEEVGIRVPDFQLDAVGYSPRSRGVFKVSAAAGDKLVFRPGVGLSRPDPRALVYLKVRRPKRAEGVREAHDLLAERLSAPRCFAHHADLGLLALEPIEGEPLWDRIWDGHTGPEPDELIDLLARIEHVPMGRASRRSVSGAVARNAEFLKVVVPERADALDEFVGALGPDAPQPEVTIHGDFHEVQVLLGENGITGILDLDDAGRGQRVDDLAMMAGRFHCYADTYPDPAGNVVAYSERLIEGFGEHVGHRELRRRAASVALNHATNPFRYQQSGWLRLTRDAIDRACAFQTRLARA